MRPNTISATMILAIAMAPPLTHAGTVRGTVTLPSGDTRSAVVSIEGPKIPASPGAKVAMDQHDLTFVPHVLPIVIGTEVEFKNDDSVFHNVFAQSDGSTFNFGIMQGRSKARTFDRPGVVPIQCNVHSEMNAFLVVKENPYFAQPGPGGAYTIPNVPAGTYRVAVWYPHGTPQEKSITVPGSGEVVADFVLQAATR